MASAEISFDLKEVEGLAKLFERTKLSSAERTQLLTNLGNTIEYQTQERFDLQISPEGKRWEDVAQKTKDYYLDKGKGGSSTLVLTGMLRQSIVSQPGDWSVLVGATMVYAAIHQFGGTIRAKGKALYVPGYGMLQQVTIPARPYLGISTSDAEEIALETQKYIAERITARAS